MGTFKNIAVLTGAGISVSAGIPDFRSEDGIYKMLGEYNLPDPTAIFEINYFKEHPEVFFKFSKNVFAGQFQPTPTHYFISFLEKKGYLLFNLTQNIDGLELPAGLPIEKLVQAHGTMERAHCLECMKEIDVELMKQHLKEGKVLRCECEGLCKPDVVFFGESLPPQFFLALKV